MYHLKCFWLYHNRILSGISFTRVYAKRVKELKRTKISDKWIKIILKSVLPVALAFLIFSDGVTKGINNILNIGFFTTGIMSRFSDNDEKIKNNESLNSHFQVNGTELYENSVSSDIPDDIIKLMNEAEKIYADSSNDGKITEYDYSRQNATSQFEGIYIRNTTLEHPIKIHEYLNRKVYVDVDKSKPVVLVYHTHASETYELLDRGFYTNERSSRSENNAENMIRVGVEICKTLEEKGFKTIHDKTIYDTEYSGAYDRSCTAISEILRNNPSIQVVLDVHRGSIYQKDGSRIKTVTKLNGRKAAQIQIISGCEDANVTDFPNWEKNLTFALNLQKQLAGDNPTIVRPLMFCSRKYNMHLMPGALQIEIGTDANTLGEAVYSAKLFAESLVDFLEEYK